MTIFDKGADPFYAHEVGYSDGQVRGHKKGLGEGLDIGRKQGFANGHNAGYNEGWNAAYNVGWNDCLAQANKTIVDANFNVELRGWKVRALMETLQALAPMVMPKLSAEDQERLTFALSITPHELDNSETGPVLEAFLHSPEYQSFYNHYFQQTA